ncbi:diguanylate cyclase [Nautilia profundicola AmH]|uniref:diguanylate cyclase n=1 Tax=Nautilia profundicola (strain ATCC BAA-1463 / DSM 18972 / AmH) TaxID=598659 RepID=B9L9J0_NAUPA|nr:GGDEF domain-containing protein [Nautilia profundicola]ACM92231.1 diguanylate cyclase [Nautilia profundicola AmH]
MEEMIIKISENVLEELKKVHKPPYPLYYKNVFVSLVRKEGIFEELNPKLLCVEPDINEALLTKTVKTIKEVNNVSKEIKQDSETLIEEVAPLQIDEIKEAIMQFSAGLLQKINRLEETVHSLEVELDKAYKELLIDPLTKVYNRKALNNDLNEILEKGKDKNLDLVIAIVDLDLFKEINDKYGHLVGDFVLIKIANIIRKMIRKENKIYRYGGDEFIIVFNRMTLAQVKPIIQRIVHKIESTLLKYKDDLIKVTVSVGLTQHKQGDTFDEIIKRADHALYQAKVKRNGYEVKE